MGVVGAIDSAVVAAGTALWLDSHATPLAWLVAVGVVVLGAWIARSAVSAPLARQGTAVSSRKADPAAGPDDEESPRHPALRVRGLTAPRAPGRVLVRAVVLR